jgi:hypothetical protein
LCFDWIDAGTMCFGVWAGKYFFVDAGSGAKIRDFGQSQYPGLLSGCWGQKEKLSSYACLNTSVSRLRIQLKCVIFG